VEFDHAINYVTTIKKRFASEPEVRRRESEGERKRSRERDANTLVDAPN
jgi:hypothetical protein